MTSWFDDEVSALERRTLSAQGSVNPILFYGSSSFTLWHDIEQHFPGYNVVNHGFGGSTLADCIQYFDRLVVPIAPRMVVVYAGDNDLADGASPEAVLSRVATLVRRKRDALGAVPMAFVSIKVSPARFAIMHRIAYTNLIVERALFEQQDVRFVDITRRMVGRGMGSLLELYSEDPLHMNRDGYRVLARSLFEYITGIERHAGDLRVGTALAHPAWRDPPERDAMPDALSVC
ncbi:MAG: GDSL family lipase [Rhodospirillales bacterium]|nr:GDSL family lipase [Rhodospirillales bacterium]